MDVDVDMSGQWVDHRESMDDGSLCTMLCAVYGGMLCDEEWMEYFNG